MDFSKLILLDTPKVSLWKPFYILTNNITLWKTKHKIKE